MAMNSCVVVFFSLALFATASFAQTGGYEPIKDPNNQPEMVELAKFAIDQFNKVTNNIHLTYVRIVSGGEKHIDDGTNYKLMIVAYNGPDPKNEDQYEALVWVELGNKSKGLISFKPVVGHV